MSRSVLLTLARESIEEVLETRNIIDRGALVAEHPALERPMATFVTLTVGGELRGCIGTLVAHRPLVDDIIHNAKAAAFQDPRFPPLSASEYPRTAVEVSLLSEPQEVSYRDTQELKSIIRPGVDGVILALGGRQATFLPQVWEQLPDFETFFVHLGHKAGIGGNALEFHPQIFTYQVEKAKDAPLVS